VVWSVELAVLVGGEGGDARVRLLELARLLGAALALLDRHDGGGGPFGGSQLRPCLLEVGGLLRDGREELLHLGELQLLLGGSLLASGESTDGGDHDQQAGHNAGGFHGSSLPASR
jgi:hypothetical protein